MADESLYALRRRTLLAAIEDAIDQMVVGVRTVTADVQGKEIHLSIQELPYELMGAMHTPEPEHWILRLMQARKPI